MGTANLNQNKSIKSSQGILQMESIRIDSYEIKTSRNNLKVPVINDVHLHSMYNPAKEAQAIVSKHDTALSSKKHVLILGLGFAYHVYEVCRKLENYHGNDYKVVVIEPNEQIYRDCITNHLFPNKNIEVYSGESLDKVYSELNLVKFLIDKPAIIAHPASFGLYNNFFTAFLDYQAPQNLTETSKHLRDKKLKSYICDDKESDTLDEFIMNNVLSKPSFNNELDHMLLAYSHLSNGDF